MARESREVWAKRVERWRDSGLSAKEFAEEIGIKPSSLRYWSWRVNADRRRADAAKPSPMQAEALTWVEVAAPKRAEERAATPPTTGEKLELVLGSGLVVRVPARFEPEALRRLLTVIG